MFSSEEIRNAIGVDQNRYEKLSQRTVGHDTAGERSRLFVDLLDTDMNSLDVDFVLGYLEAKALVELGVFLLPAPVDWPSSNIPSTRHFIPAQELFASSSSSSSSSASAATTNSATAGNSNNNSASNTSSSSSSSSSSGAALAHASNWKAPPASISKHFAAQDSSQEMWTELISFIQDQSVKSLQRLGFVSSLPKKVWGAVGDITFAAAAASSVTGGGGGGSALDKKNNNNKTKKKKSKKKNKKRDDDDLIPYAKKGQFIEDDEEEEEEDEEDEEEDEYITELKEMQERKQRYLKKLEREKQEVLLKPFLLVDNDVELNIDITPVHLRLHGFTADPSPFFYYQQQQQQRGFPSSSSSSSSSYSTFPGSATSSGSVDSKKQLHQLATLQRRSEVAAKRTKLAEGSAVSLHAPLDPPGAVVVDWHHRCNLAQAKKKQQKEQKEKENRISSSNNKNIYTSSSSSSSSSASFEDFPELSVAESSSNLVALLDASSSSSSSASSSPMLMASGSGSGSSGFFVPQQTSVVSEDTEMWLALKGIVFRIPWKVPSSKLNNNTSSRKGKRNQNESDDDAQDGDENSNNNSEHEGENDEHQRQQQQQQKKEWSPNSIPKKNFTRAAEGRRMYYRTVLCPLMSGFDITTTFLTAPGRELDEAMFIALSQTLSTSELLQQQQEESDEILLSEIDNILKAAAVSTKSKRRAKNFINTVAAGSAFNKGRKQQTTQEESDHDDDDDDEDDDNDGNSSKLKMSPLSQTKAAFKRNVRVHINRVFELFLHDMDVVGELVECEQVTNPPWF